MSSVANDLAVEHDVHFKVNRPRDNEANRHLKKCGFYNLIGGVDPSTIPHTGRIVFRQYDKVDPSIASELADFAAREFFPDCADEPWFRKKRGGVYRTLVECMSNTIGHASEKEGLKERWWAAVNYDENRDLAVFSFVDHGVGILKSGNVQWYRKVADKLHLTSNPIMRDIMHGKMPSRTGKEERGEGLPSMRIDCQKRGLIDDLVIIANDVRANVARDEYINLETPFRGTFTTWTLTRRKP